MTIRSMSVRPAPKAITWRGETIPLTAVVSSNVEAVGYSAERQQLVVVFRSGAAYLYHQFSETSYTLLMADYSKGKWLVEHVVGNQAYPYERIREG